MARSIKKTPKTVRHGMFRIPDGCTVNDPAFNCWKTMLSRCLMPNTQSYASYGAKGVKVCDRWMCFAAFLEDMGPRPSKEHTLDRYPNGEGNYEPGNVRWATVEEQMANRWVTVWVEFDGQKRTMADWAKIKGISRVRLWHRLEAGWSVEEALMTPTRHWSQTLEHEGRSMTVQEWAKELDIPEATLRHRMRSGWPDSKVVTTPSAPGRPRKKKSA